MHATTSIYRSSCQISKLFNNHKEAGQETFGFGKALRARTNVDTAKFDGTGLSDSSLISADRLLIGLLDLLNRVSEWHLMEELMTEVLPWLPTKRQKRLEAY